MNDYTHTLHKIMYADYDFNDGIDTMPKFGKGGEDKTTPKYVYFSNNT